MTVTPMRSATGLEDLLAFLDDDSTRRIKYEVIDGSIVVNPPPTSRHELVTFAIHVQLAAACPPHLIQQTSYGWRYNPLEPDHFFEPDIAVVPRSGLDLDASLHDQVPLLILETRSTSTWRLDEGVKRDLYAAGGVQSYWLLDPRGPRVRVLTLRAGEYVEETVLDGPGEFTVTEPFPVTIRL